jgi:transcription termination/antitermination protein NusA
VLPRKEQSRAESYTPGERIRAVIKGVNRSAKGPQIVLSRTDPALLIKLFEQEVPEIYDGTVMIRGAVREAGDRAKVAVFSRERDVDPVGACVGMKGTRVQAIIRELRGEKIDIVEWSEDAIAFVTNALSPAKVQRVSIVDDRERVMEVIVEDKQLSLAIGKKGQNVRLAAKLTGWRIDIKSEEEKRREVEAQFGELEIPAQSADLSADLSAEAETDTTSAKADADPDAASATAKAGAETSDAAETTAQAETDAQTTDEAEPPASDVPVPYTLEGVGEKTVRKLVDGGFATLEALGAATVEQLSAIPGIGEKKAEKILFAARGDAPAEDEA